MSQSQAQTNNDIVKSKKEEKKKKKKKEVVLDIKRDKSIIPLILKQVLIKKLVDHMKDESDKDEFRTLCMRVESIIAAWYQPEFDELKQDYTLFDPLLGPQTLEQQKLSPQDIDGLEQNLLDKLFRVLQKSNFKLITNTEVSIAHSGQHLLRLPIKADDSKLDKELLKKYFDAHRQEKLPDFCDKYVIFSRGMGTDEKTDYFFMDKVNLIFGRVWSPFTRLKELVSRRSRQRQMKDLEKNDESQPNQNGLSVDRIRLEDELSCHNLLRKITIKEPTFERIIVIYRRAATESKPESGIFVKHFKDIPMADMEIVLPEKKNPGLTLADWIKFIGSAIVGLVAVASSFKKPKLNIWFIATVIPAVVAYIGKTYFEYRRNLAAYQKLMTRTMYDKQLDSGNSTLLHLCDEAIQQEVKEVIIAFFILMTEHEKATIEDLDRSCERLIKNEFDQICDFEVDDAIQKLVKLGIVTQDNGHYKCVGLKEANKIIGITTEELVLQAKRGNVIPPSRY